MLLDTSGLLSYVDRRDARHADATSLFLAAPTRLTHSYVLAELAPLCHVRGVARPTVLAFLSDLQDDPGVDVVWVDELLHRAALLFLGRRPDKTYSLCDAVSFLIMRQRGVTEALTTDRHFDQEGFARLLKP